MCRAPSMMLLGVITVLWLIGVAFLGDTIILGVLLTVPGLGALAMCARQARAGRYEAVSPWACCALVWLAFLGILALADVHLHEFTGAGPGWECDAMAQNCNPQPLQGLAHATSLISFITAGIAIVRLISYSSHRTAGNDLETADAD